MKILLVDDNPHKIRVLGEFINATFPEAVVLPKRSYQSGLKSALLDLPDLIILDMTMPTYDVGGKETGGRERRYAGHHILRQLKRKENTTPVIIVTQFEKFGEGDELVTLAELRQQLEAEFPTGYVGVVYYQAADSRWRAELHAALIKSGFLCPPETSDDKASSGR